ncbi:unnamed protein product, partial [Protopolystoma xenopodis]
PTPRGAVTGQPPPTDRLSIFAAQTGSGRPRDGSVYPKLSGARCKSGPGHLVNRLLGQQIASGCHGCGLNGQGRNLPNRVICQSPQRLSFDCFRLYAWQTRKGNGDRAGVTKGLSLVRSSTFSLFLSHSLFSLTPHSLSLFPSCISGIGNGETDFVRTNASSVQHLPTPGVPFSTHFTASVLRGLWPRPEAYHGTATDIFRL